MDSELHLLRNAATGATIAHSVRRPRSAWGRAAGLIGRPALAAGTGLWLEPCSAVHTIGMRCAIDIVFLDAARRVLAVVPGVRPLRPVVTRRGTAIVLELPAGSAKAHALVAGSELTLVARAG